MCEESLVGSELDSPPYGIEMRVLLLQLSE